MNNPVDVLIIGAGASGAAVAWSLADTRMHILCLEQGGWMNPETYPSVGRDWEARAYGDYFPRLHPSDFRVRSLDGVAEDWPVDYETLAPFFEDNDRMMGVSGLAGDPG